MDSFQKIHDDLIELQNKGFAALRRAVESPDTRDFFEQLETLIRDLNTLVSTQTIFAFLDILALQMSEGKKTFSFGDMIEHLISHMELEQSEIDVIINKCLDFHADNHEALGYNEEGVLQGVYLLMKQGASKEVGERVMCALVSSARVQYVEETARYLNREVTREEVQTLVDVYTSNKTSKFRGDSERLVSLAKQVLSPEEVYFVEEKIRVFHESFHNNL